METFHVFDSQISAGVFNEGQFFLDGIHQKELHIGPQDGQGHAGESGAGAKVKDPSLCRKIFRIVYGE